MTPEEKYELIERYLEGALVGTELDVFKKMMREDPDFAYDVNIQQLIFNQIREHRRQELKQLIAREGEVKYIQNIWGTKWLYASAAIILFFTGFYFVVEYVLKPGEPTEQSGFGSEDGPATDSTLFSETSSDSMKLKTAKKELPIDTSIALAIAEPDVERLDEILSENAEEYPESRSFGMELGDSILLDDSEDYIASDVKISSRSYEVGTSVHTEKLISVKTSKKSETTKQEEISDDEPEERETSNQPENDKLKPIRLLVEFWKSPVNFRGYSYQKGVLVLFGVDPSESLQFVQGDNGMTYMKRQGAWYTLVPNAKDKPFNKLTDPEILKTLSH